MCLFLRQNSCLRMWLFSVVFQEIVTMIIKLSTSDLGVYVKSQTKAVTHGKAGTCDCHAWKGLKLEPEARELDSREFCKHVKERMTITVWWGETLLGPFPLCVVYKTGLWSEAGSSSDWEILVSFGCFIWIFTGSNSLKTSCFMISLQRGWSP